MSGTLYVCATPIGNLEDITYRVVRTLREVDLIAAEDTRNSIKLLNYFDIKTPMTSYHEYNRFDKANYLVKELLDGKNIALITDAGTPGISDPGEVLVAMCVEAGVTVTALPGAMAGINALIMSGLPTRRFCFEAFLTNEKKERQQVLEELAHEHRTIVMYEAPHRLTKTLQALEELFGADRRVAVCRELTKKHEEAVRGTLAQVREHFEQNEPKGEFVLVIEGASYEKERDEKEKEWAEMDLSAHMNLYLERGMDRKEAMKQVAADRGISKRDVYKELLEESGE